MAETVLTNGISDNRGKMALYLRRTSTRAPSSCASNRLLRGGCHYVRDLAESSPLRCVLTVEPGTVRSTSSSPRTKTAGWRRRGFLAHTVCVKSAGEESTV